MIPIVNTNCEEIKMTAQEARNIFDACIAKYDPIKDADRIAKAEICREYFTNAQFRDFMEQCIWSINKTAPRR